MTERDKMELPIGDLDPCVGVQGTYAHLVRNKLSEDFGVMCLQLNVDYG